MIAAAVIVLVAVIVIVLVARRADRRVAEATARMEEQVIARQKALDKQAKVFVARLARTERGAAKAVDAANGLSAQVQQVLCDPTIQGALERGARAQEDSDGR